MSFEEWVLKIDSFLWGWPLIVILLGTGLFISIRLRFIQFWGLPHGLALITGRYDDPEDPGEISHFQALSAALSATIGIGNIAGVATAIHMGGPGALFWMWVTAIVNAPLKYAGILLSHKYRTLHPDGEASGGPMYYLEKGLHAKPLAMAFAFFAAIASFGIGNMVQANTVADKLRSDLHIPPIITGIVLSILLGMVILGGIKRIAAVASRLVPFMCLMYVIGAFAVLIAHVDQIPVAFKLIFTYAFNPVAITGGFAGTAVRYAIEFGVKRGLFSNESGLGSASIAHAAAKTKEAVREGLVGQLGPFIDTLLICTMTGLVILVTGAWHTKTVDFTSPGSVTAYIGNVDNLHLDKIQELPAYTGDINVRNGSMKDYLTLFMNRGSIDDPEFIVQTKPSLLQRIGGVEGTAEPFTGKIYVSEGSLALPDNLAENETLIITGHMLSTGAVLTGLGFTLGLGFYAGYIVTFAVLFFAFSTAISWSYYGDRSVEYLLGRKAIFPYRIIYVIFYFVGAIMQLELVWNIADISNGLMAFPNLIGLLLMSGVLVTITKEYWDRFKSGQ